MRWEWGLLGLRLLPPAARAAIQGTRTQLQDAQAKKEQLAARVQEAQAMLAMDTSTLVLAPPLAFCLSPGGPSLPLQAGCQPGLSVGP